jgi:hypothetical protein
MCATIRAGEDNDGSMFLGGVAQAGIWFQIYFGVTRHSETIATKMLSNSRRFAFAGNDSEVLVTKCLFHSTGIRSNFQE